MRTPAGSRGTVWVHRARVVEALVLLGVAHVLRLRVPMRRWARVLGPHGPTSVPIVTGPLTGREAEVSRAIAAAVRRTGANCLEQAVAASVMLRRRRLPGLVVIGLDVTDPSQVPHAWFVGASGLVVVGGDRGRHRPVNQFGH
ncbi:MAG TPA: lasso peptide biosynthesis B2 protein [Nocardioides sp.]|nr:lasso peptide biosynthesis B2 protein [Nocardioides sp.]